MDAIECYMALTASDGFQTLTQDLGADPVVSDPTFVGWGCHRPYAIR